MKKWNVSGLMVFDEEAMIEVLTDQKSVLSFKILTKKSEFMYDEEELEIWVEDQLNVEDVREIFNEMEFDESFVVTEMEFENTFAIREIFRMTYWAVRKGWITKSEAISQINDDIETINGEDLI